MFDALKGQLMASADLLEQASGEILRAVDGPVSDATHGVKAETTPAVSEVISTLGEAENAAHHSVTLLIQAREALLGVISRLGQ